MQNVELFKAHVLAQIQMLRRLKITDALHFRQGTPARPHRGVNRSLGPTVPTIRNLLRANRKGFYYAP